MHIHQSQLSKYANNYLLLDVTDIVHVKSIKIIENKLKKHEEDNSIGNVI